MNCCENKVQSVGERHGVTRDVLLITFMAGILFLPSLFTRDLWNPDEPRYMEVAREMVLLDDYLVPHLNGELYPDKPPMFFWLTAGLYRAGFGYNAGRIVAVLASLGTVLLTYFLGCRLFSRQGGLFAALATLTAGIFLATSKMGVIDPLLAFFTTGSIYAGLRAMGGEGLRFRQWWLISYAAAGLAILTKGPVGLAVPLIVLITCGYAWGKKVRKGGWIHLGGVILLLGIVAAWLVPALVRGGEGYADNILFKQNLGRVIRSYSHRNPVYYYLLNSAWMFLPWTLFFVAAVWSAVKAWRRPEESAARLELVWCGAVFIFFTLISGKRAGYFMPLMPAFGLLMGRYFLLVNRGRHLWHRAHKIFVGVTLGIFAVGFLAVVPGIALVEWICKLAYPGDSALMHDVHLVMKGSLPWAVAASISGLLIVFLAWRAILRQDKQKMLFPALAAIILLLSLFGDMIVLPRANHFKSVQNLVRAGKGYLSHADSLFLYPKDYDGVYNLYTGHVAIPVLKGPEELKNALAASKKVAVIAHERHASKVLRSHPQVGYVAASARVGHRKMLVLSNWIQGHTEANACSVDARK